jgi:hypothetical protein
MNGVFHFILTDFHLNKTIEYLDLTTFIYQIGFSIWVLHRTFFYLCQISFFPKIMSTNVKNQIAELKIPYK